jgi:hypothetical protein
MGPDAKEAIPDLVAGLKDGEIRFVAMTALAGRGPEMVPVLVAAMEDPEIRPHAKEVLALLGESAIPGLREVLASGPAGTDRHAMKALLELGPGAVPVLIDLLGVEHAKPAAAAGLAALGEKGLPVFLATLVREPLAVRRRAVPAMAGCRPVVRPFMDAFVATLADPVHADTAILNLAILGDEAVPALVSALRSGPTRDGALRALEIIGAPAAPALERVVAAEADAAVQAVLRQALARATAPAPPPVPRGK